MLSDFGCSVRSLSRSPFFTLSAVLTLTLGIGANAAVFSVVEAVLLHPLPYAEPDRLVRIWETNPTQGIERADVSPGSFVEWRARTRTLEGVALYMARDWVATVKGEVEAVRGARVSSSLFQTLGVAPILGRTFRPEGEEREVVIGYSIWQRRFGGRADVVGQTWLAEGYLPSTIVGVMPQGFAFPAGVEVWGSDVRIRAVGPRDFATRYYEAIGRVRRGLSLEAARADLSAVQKQIAAEHPESTAGFGVQIERLDRTLVEGVRTPLLIVLAVVGCVLLIACANVASLLLARATSRRHEVAVRLALGARWTRVLRQSFSDGLLLAAAGTALGGLLAFAMVRLLMAAAPADLPRVDGVTFGFPVMVFAVIVALVSAFLTALPPVLQARRLDIHETLKTGGRGQAPASARRMRGWLIGGEVALTLALLVGCMLLLRSFVALRGVDLGFERRHVLTAEMRLTTGRFFVTNRRPWFQLAQHYDSVISTLATLPGVGAVGGVTGLPLTGNGDEDTFWLGDTRLPDSQARAVDIRVVTPGYLDAMKTPVIRGRGFMSTDRLTEEQLTKPSAEGSQRPTGVVMVNDAFARRYFQERDPLGASLVVSAHTFVRASTIVGVVRDVREHGIGTPPTPLIYVPFGEMPGFRLSVAVSTTAELAGVASLLKDRLHELDPQMMVSQIRPLDDVVSGALSRAQFTLLLVASFALIALGLSGVGIYSIVAFLVANRTREIGVRIALGARSKDVVRLVLRDGLLPVAVGAAAGCAVAAVSVGTLRSLLFGVLPFDPASFALAGFVVALVALAAALIPARHAIRVDPMVALREE